MLDRLITRAIVAVVFVLSLAPSPAASASEFLFVDDFEIGATLTGRVLDTNAFVDQGVELPVEGVVVTLLGVSDSSVTGSDGSFILRNVPPGEQVLDLNTGSAIPAPTGDGYAGFRERIVLQGFENVLRPFYLPRIDASSLTTIDPSQTTVVENPGLEISMTVVAGSARGEDGSLFDGQLSISEVPGGVAPAALPAFLEPGILITVQPVGVTFDPPAPITFPNFDNLPPGSETDLWSLDPELGQFAIVGTGQVSGDGERIETISGGIIAADWHGAPPPPPEDGDGDGDGPPSCKGCCPSCSGSVGSSVDLFNGEFSESVRLPTVLSMNREWAPEFVYTSKRAFPLSVIPINSGIVSRAATPNMISYRGFIEDELVQDEIFIDTSTLAPATDEPFRVAVPFDNTALETGIHDAEVRITSIYDRSRISSSNATPLTVVNEIDSPFGAGWSLNGLDRLVLDEPGTIRERLLLVQGDGGAIQLEEQLTGVNPDGIITIIILNGPTGPVQSQETAALAGVLTDMGFAFQIVDAIDFSQEHVDQSRLLIWVDASFVIIASNTDIAHIPGLLTQARDNGMPIYFLGSEPANFRDFTNDGTADAFIETWLNLIGMELASSTSGGEGLVNVLVPDHPIFSGPAGSLTEFTIGNDSDVTRNANPSAITLAASATADIVVVSENVSGSRNVIMNSSYLWNQPVENRPNLEIIFRNSVDWLLDSPSISSGFFGEGQFAAVDGDYSGIIRDEVAGTFTRVLRDGTIHLYDGSGLLTSVIDRNGNMTTHGYDGSGRLQTITDPAGRVTTFAYDANGNLDTVTDAAGRITDFTVDASGNLSDMTLPDGSTRAFGYDARHLMTSQTDARGFTTQYEYDDLGIFERSTQADGSVREVSPTQKVGLVDLSGGLGTPSNPAPIVRPASALSGFTDPEGRVLTAETGRFGEPTAVNAYTGLETTINRNADGNPIQADFPSGASLARTFSSSGNKLTETDPALGRTLSYTYDPVFSQLLTRTGPFGEQTQITYDAQGNILTYTSPVGRLTELSYLSNGLRDALTTRVGMTVNYAYDSLDNLQGMVFSADGESRNYSSIRNAIGLLESETNPENHTTQYTYDAMGRLTQMAMPDARVLTYTHTDEGYLASVTPPGRPATIFNYDDTGLPSVVDWPSVIGGGTQQTSYAFNGAQDLTAITRADGITIQYQYDSAGRLINLSLPQGDYLTSYDALTGLKSSVVSPGGITQSFSYNDDLLTGVTWSGAVTGDVTFVPDVDGRVGSLVVAGQSYAFTYNHDDEPTAVGDMNLVYDAVTGLLESTTLDGIDEVFEYNGFGELKRHTVNFGASVLYDVIYTRDAMARIVTRDETIQGVFSSYEYTYDDTGRLVTVEKDAAVLASYSYDSNNNRTINGATYDDQDRLTSEAGIIYNHNAHGERTLETAGGSLTNYQYNGLGRLIGATLPSGVQVDYLLDGQESRAAKMINATLVKSWLYASPTQVVAELDGLGTVMQRYIYAPHSNAPAYIDTASTRYKVVSDHLGSIRLIVDSATGAVMQRMDHGPWGETELDTNPGFQPFGYAAGMVDQHTSLVHFGAREYDPETGRWTTKDPKGFMIYVSNLYEYVNSDPINLIDPTGFSPNAPAGGSPEDSSVGRIESAHGAKNVYIQRAGECGWQPAKPGTSVCAGDRVKTDGDTMASVLFFLGGNVQIGKSCEVQIKNNREVDVISEGNYWIKFDPNRLEGRNKTVKIQTAGGVMGIRG